MHRLIVVILSAIDAAIAAAVGIAATLAPLTLLWVLGLGGTADWATLWPAAATIWQFGNLVPLQVDLPGEYLAVAGIDPGAASFSLSLAPLAFAAFTAIFAARSGVRASRADAWITGLITGSLIFAALAAVIASTSANQVASVVLWQAILLPSLVFALPLLVGAIVTEWREAGAGAIARLRDRIEAAADGWGETPGLVVRGAGVVLAGLIGLGALICAVSIVLRAGQVVALFEASQVDALGASVVTLAQLAYLPTLAIWGISFIAGPGFAVGSGTAVSPVGTQLGVTPGIPALGALPESTTGWLLLLALAPVALGALAGWIARSTLVARTGARDRSPIAVDEPGLPGHARNADPVGARLVIAFGIAVLSGAGAALLSVVASGSIGPGRLAQVGPEPGAVALAVAVEVLIGAAILLLSPQRAEKRAPEERAPDADAPAITEPITEPIPVPSAAVVRRYVPSEPGPDVTAPVGTAPADLGARRPEPLPPLPPRTPPAPPLD